MKRKLAHIIVLLVFISYTNKLRSQSHNSISLEAKSNTYIADSLNRLGEYNQALKYWTLALKEPNQNRNYNIFLKTRWQYTKSCIYETEGGLENHAQALKHSLKARDIYKSHTNPSIWLKHQIANRIYHQYGYTQNWGKTLIEAQNNLAILQDSLPLSHINTLLILDDLGYINGKLGDYTKSLEYYDRSLQLYLKHHSNNKRDIAMNYTQMANNYRHLGMRKKELDILLSLEKLYNEIPEKSYSVLLSCYKELNNWYSYYGNYELANTYLKKQESIIDSIEHKANEFNSQRRNKYLNLYKSYIELNLKKKDYTNARKYIVLSENELKASTREFIHDIEHEAEIYFYNAQLPERSIVESIELIKKAVNLIELFKGKFFLDPMDYKIALFEKLKEVDRYDEAIKQMEDLINSADQDNEHRLFYLYTNYAQLLSKNNNFKLAEDYFKKAMSLYMIDNISNCDLKQISINQFKPFYSYESLDGIVMTANFFLKYYLKTKNSVHLQSSRNLFFLASDMFSNFYLGDRYNENLYTTNKSIEKGLITILQYNTSQNAISRTVEAIENNASKLTWSKFLYSIEKPKLHIPDSIIEREDELKSLIGHYQNAIYNNFTELQIKSDTLQGRILNLNLELKSLQEHIKVKYSQYYNLTHKPFNLGRFRENLNNNNLILKYVFVEENLFCFLISKSSIALMPLSTNDKLSDAILKYINKISTFNSDLKEGSAHLNAVVKPLIDQRNKTHITIIPDGVLNYLPFETLLIDNGLAKSSFTDYTFNYSNSLTLLQEQNNINYSYDKIRLGVFSSTHSGSLELPSTSKESNDILKYFNGKLYNNSSKQSFLKTAKNYNILHLAMHSTINNSKPEFSSLEFGDDRLLISDLYHESLNAQLAVLSACETGGGSFLKGEGIQSISMAFTYTGIPSTVVSLWKVDDRATSIIMDAFYKHLKEGKSKDVALSNAKKDYLKNTDDIALKHPYYWAGFVLSGNTSPMVKNNSSYLYASVASVSFLIFFIFIRNYNFLSKTFASLL